jgi:hypothetical protein
MVQNMDYQNHHAPFLIQGERDTWEIPEVVDKVSFKTSEHENTFLRMEEEFVCMFDESNALRRIFAQQEDCRLYLTRQTH